MTTETKTELNEQHEAQFKLWNESIKEEKFKITKRNPYTEDFLTPIFGQRLIKTSIKDGKEIESASAKIEYKLLNGRQMGYNIEMPTVVCRNGFQTKKVKGADVSSISVTLYRSNPDHLKFINNMLWLKR